MKGLEKRKGRRKERAVEHQLITSRSSSRGTFLLGYQQRTTLTHFNLSREYQLLPYSLHFSRTKIDSKRPVVIYPLWGEGEKVGQYRWLHKRCYKDEDCRAKGCLKTKQEIACKLIILRTTCFLHQNTSQLLWFKEKTLLQSKFCCKLKSSITKVSKCGVHSVQG